MSHLPLITLAYLYFEVFVLIEPLACTYQMITIWIASHDWMLVTRTTGFSWTIELFIQCSIVKGCLSQWFV